MSAPEVSVVMGVYNGAAHLRETVDSVLQQEKVDLEFIVVDDGSTDETPAILASYASRDRRLSVVHQQNSGLTRALIRGCALARGDYIARQDCGDRSLPSRLRKQVEHIRESPARKLVSCITSFVAPQGEFLYTSGGAVDDEEVRNSLLTADVATIRGLSHHGSAMFARSTYRNAGGYRDSFYFAQDLDLWIRIARLGNVSFVQERLYEARVTPDSISSAARSGQLAAAAIILRARDAEERGEDATELLQPSHLQSAARETPARRRAALGHYFIGRALQKNGDRAAAARYLRQSLRIDPLLLRAWVALFGSRFR